MTERVGQLFLKRGEEVSETKCQWSIGDTSEPNGDHVILVLDPDKHCR